MESSPSCFRLTAASSLSKYPAKQHAQDVAHKLGIKQGLIYLPGQPTIWQEDTDEPFPFRQRRYFYYLSGVDERDCHLTYDIGKDHLTLYIPYRDQRWVIYHGTGVTVDEARDRYDVDEVKYTSTVQKDVQKWTKRRPSGAVFLLHLTQEAYPGQNELPHVDFTKLQMAIDRCRVIKDPHEIEMIRKANDISAQAHRTVLTNIGGLQNESQVEAIFKEICISRLAKNQAYDVIAAAGENAATLHYMRNTDPFADKQLMVLDAGCEWDLYASDVTRTFPLRGGGEWPSKEANAIHDLVQSMQNACIERVKPGTRFLDLHKLAHQIAVKGLLQLGILRNGVEKDILEAGTSLAFFPHGLGHHLGLETHDVSDVPINSLREDIHEEPINPIHAVLLSGGMGLRSPVDARSGGLEEGMVVTIEPGIYFNRYAIENMYLKSPVHAKYINKELLDDYYPVGGVRIEDDILVTKNGYDNLTTAPKGEEMLSLIRRSPRIGTNLLVPASIGPMPSGDVSPTSQRSLPLRQGASLHDNFRTVLNKVEVPAIDPLPAKQGTTLHDGFRSALSSNSQFDSRPECSPTTQEVTTRHTKRADAYYRHEIEDDSQDLRADLRCKTCTERKRECDGGLPECDNYARGMFAQKDYDSESDEAPRGDDAFDAAQPQTYGLPSVPSKTPHLPRKPLAYRQSVSNFADPDVYHPRLASISNASRALARLPEQLTAASSEFHGHGVGIAATSRICGLRRAQSQLLPNPHGSPFSDSLKAPHRMSLERASTQRRQTTWTEEDDSILRGSRVTSEPFSNTGRLCWQTQTAQACRPRLQHLNVQQDFDTPPLPVQQQNAERDIIFRIAAVTATYVHSIPQNRNKDVTGDEIRRILEANPTLTDLVRLLRAMDLQVGECDLANALSDAVPGIDLSGLAKAVQPSTMTMTAAWDRPLDSAGHPFLKVGTANGMLRDQVGQPDRMVNVRRFTGRHEPSAISPASRIDRHDTMCALLCEQSVKAGGKDSSTLSGTHEWVEQRMSRMMSDSFLNDKASARARARPSQY